MLKNKAFLVRVSVNYPELIEFNYIELVLYKMEQSLLQTPTTITNWGNFITKWVGYYKFLGLLTDKEAFRS